jgi:DNA-directed RNA polymerase subunit RPC12/RpoP
LPAGKEDEVKKATGVIIAVIILYYPATAFGVTAFDGETAETSTIAQASNGVYCPECGAKNEAGAIYCANCGKKLPELRTDYNFCPKCGEKTEPADVYCAYCAFRLTELAKTRPAESRWESSLLTLSLGVGGWFGSRTCAAPTADLVFNVSDYFAFGPDLSYFFHGDGSGYLAGLEFRPYIVPYSRSYFLKPHATVGVGFGREKVDVSWRYFLVRRWYVRPGAGLDVRIAESRFVPYFDWTTLIFFGGKEYQEIEEDQKLKTAFVFEGGIRITL